MPLPLPIVNDVDYLRTLNKKRKMRQILKVQEKEKRSRMVRWNPNNKTLMRKEKWRHLRPRGGDNLDAIEDDARNI